MGGLAWKILAAGAAAVSTTIAQRAVDGAWKTTTGKNPPSNPANPDIAWKDAVGWALLSGVVIAIARLIATRKAAQYYRHSSGTLPKTMR